MRKYTIRRLLLAIPTLVVMSLVVFGVLRIIPGDVALLILGGNDAVAVYQTSLDTLREELGLTKPLHEQYLSWIWDMVRLDLGNSLVSGRPIADDLIYRLPLTLQITFMAFFIGIFLGIPIGIISAIRQNTWIDYALRFFSILLLAAPSFWVGLIILLVGVRFFNYSPPLGYNLIWENPKDNLLQLTWPAVIIGVHMMAFIARMTRSTMLEVVREDYIRTARAKGLSESVVVMRHAIKNALIPVATVAGYYIGYLLGGTVVLELVFSIPGVGLFFLEAIEQRDYTVVQAVVFFLASSFIFLNLLVDLLYGWLDPRVSYS